MKPKNCSDLDLMLIREFIENFCGGEKCWVTVTPSGLDISTEPDDRSHFVASLVDGEVVFDRAVRS